MGAWLLTRVFVAAVLIAASPALAAKDPPKGKAQAGKQDKKTEKDKKGEKADPRVWTIAKGEDTYVLRYGAPRAADPTFAVACRPVAQLIQFTVEVASGKVKAGDGVAVSLSAGKRRLELAASSFRGATEGSVVAEAAVTLDGKVLDLFADGDSLTVKIPGAKETYPLAGAKAKLPDFRRACLGGR